MRATTAMYARNVPQSTRKSAVNVPGCVTDATNPAASPPTATPRFIARRCSAYAGARFVGGASAVIIADCEGQNAPLPNPQTVYRAKASQATRISGINP